MKAITLTKEKFSSLHQLYFPYLNTEGRLFVLNDNLLFKRLYRDEGEVFGNKLLTLNTLIDNREILNDNNLILPEKIVLVDKKVVGFSMPYIKDNISLMVLLDDKGIALEEKVKYLKKVGNILENVQNVSKFKDNFFLGDVQPTNFIIDSKDFKLNDLYAVDVDSCRIGDNLPFPSHILTTNFNIREHKKYKLSKNGLIEPNANTEWFCYNIMILNFISKFNINSLSESKFNDYIQYLEDIGLNKDLVNCFSKLYSKDENNINPRDMLDSIGENIDKADYGEFRKKL